MNNLKRRHESVVWAYFSKLPNGSMNCNFCGRVLQHIHATNAKKHLKGCKPDIYQTVLETDGSRQVFPKKSYVEVIKNDSWSIDFPSAEFNRQKKNFCELASLLEVPFSFFTTPEFHRFLMEYKKGFEPPTTVQGIKNLIMENAAICHNKLQWMIATRRSKVSLTVDIWCDESRNPYLAITGYFFDKDFIYRNVFFGVRKFNNPDSSIQQTIYGILKEYNLDINDIEKIVTENEANMIKVWKEFECYNSYISDMNQLNTFDDLDSEQEENDFKDFVFETTNNEVVDFKDMFFESKLTTCLAHTMQLICCDAVEHNNEFSTMMKDARYVIKKIKERPEFRQTIFNFTNFMPILPLKSRWMGNYLMSERILQIYHVINDYTSYKIDEKMINYLTDFVRIFKPIFSFIQNIQKDSKPILSSVFGQLMTIREIIEQESKTTSIIGNVVERLLMEFNKRFDHYLNPEHVNFNPIIIKAALVDPDEAFCLLDFDKEILKNLIRNEVEIDVDNEPNDPIFLPHLNTFKSRMIAKSGGGLTEDPYDSYLKIMLSSNVTGKNAINFWKEPPIVLAPFQQWALAVMTTPASSVADEKTFSTTGLMAEKIKSQKYEESLNVRLITRKNSKIVNECSF